MMDVYCQRCGEPWDLEEVEDGFTPEEQEIFWAGKYCPVCRHQKRPRKTLRGQLTAILHTVLGDNTGTLALALENVRDCLGEEFWE
jgi:hypothetical protein